MPQQNDNRESPTVLLVDDEEQFRVSLKKQLAVRGYQVYDVDNGEDAIKVVRHTSTEVVVLDQKMPKMDGIQTLKELKKIRPEVQVIMLTGFGSTESALVTGKYDVFKYLQKPCGLDEIISAIDAARKERVSAMGRQEIPDVGRGSIKNWLVGAHNSRPGFLILGLLLFLAIVFIPTPERLLVLLGTEKTGAESDKLIAGYANYRKMKVGETVAAYYSDKGELSKKDASGKKTHLTPRQTALRAKVMVGILVVAALFWGTGAMPIGITALLVGVGMYFFGVLPPEGVARAYAKDAVIFIFGVLAVSGAIAKTGLDRRIGILLLGASTNIALFCFIFAPLLAVSASFLSEHALVAFLTPILVLIYGAAVRGAGIKKDRALAVMMLLMVCFVANLGGPGSPAAGGRNAVMIGILSDYGMAPSFGQWVKYGLPFVPVAALAVGLYFYLAFRNKIQIKDINFAQQVRLESQKIGKMTADEYKTAAVLILLVVLWTTSSDSLGMGGPVILSIVLLNVLGILRWRDITRIHWEVVALYASACAMGTGLAATGAALWMADSFVSILPDFLKTGEGLCIASSLFSGFITNFMSDGATVATIGPITVPMAALAGTSPIAVGLATAFASSFAHMLIIGTPNNAIAYSMAKDPETGEQLVTLKDFFVHGGMVLIISFAVLWGWTFFGYWRWIGF